MIIYAVIDTNVIVSAILSRNPDAATVKLFNLVGGSSFTILFNEEILDEYIDVLHRSKFHFPKNYIDRVVEKIKEWDCVLTVLPVARFFPTLRMRSFTRGTFEGRLLSCDG